MRATNRSMRLTLAAALMAAGTAAACAAQDIKLPQDWSHKHLVITNAATLQERMRAGSDPRAYTNWLRRSQAIAAQSLAGAPPGRGNRRNQMQRDWSVSLGAGRVAPAMSPAKFGFDASTSASCQTDYAVYGLDVAGSAGQANLVGLRNLYSGTGGACAANIQGVTRSSNVVTVTTTVAHGFAAGAQVLIAGVTQTAFNGTFTITSVPSATTFTYAQIGPGAFSGGGTATLLQATVMFAYNVSTGGGKVLTSPAISLDGTKIAFVESTGSASIFHVLTLDPCTYSVSGCTTNGTSATSAVAPGSGNSASMVSIAYSTANNTRSSPWIDYSGTGTAYVGDDNGTLYRIVNVFAGTPTLDTSFGGSGKLVVNSGMKLTGPVLAQGWLLVGDSSGLLWAMQATSPFTILGSVQVGGGQSGATIYGIMDPPVVDASVTGILSAFVTSGMSTGGNFTLVQANLNISTQSFQAATTANIGAGSGNSGINAHAPIFDNSYYAGSIINGTQGFIYACGMQAASTHPKLYRFGFTAGSPPTMSSSSNGSLALNNSSFECSPLTEFANSALSVKDILFIGDTGGEVQSFNICGTVNTATCATPGMPGGAIATVTESGGTSGIIVDTTQFPTQQGSSIYFTTQTTATSNCGTGNFCAIKLTQAALQ